jgi:hypothetical protein
LWVYVGLKEIFSMRGEREGRRKELLIEKREAGEGRMLSKNLFIYFQAFPNFRRK